MICFNFPDALEIDWLAHVVCQSGKGLSEWQQFGATRFPPNPVNLHTFELVH